MKFLSLRCFVAAAALVTTVVSPNLARAQGWEPTKPVELIVPAGTGGGADQMARFVQGLITKHKLMKQPLVVVNKAGGAGGEGFLDMKASGGNPHKLVITLSNLFTTPLATGIPFSWRDLTPVSMLALDEFVLWVNTEAPYKSAKEYLDAIKAAPNNTFSMGGTGSKQEDQIVTAALEKVTAKKLTYVPFKGGGDVAVQLVGSHVSSTVNNPIEAVAHWRAGKLRPLCVFEEKRMPFKKLITQTQSWADIPTCKESGVNVSYQMLRGIFMPRGGTTDQVAFYVQLFKQVLALPEWQEFVETGAFANRTMSGKEYAQWLQKTDEEHKTLMKEAGFLAL
jgi:putative tricarboxylic transport membrane protein